MFMAKDTRLLRFYVFKLNLTLLIKEVYPVEAIQKRHQAVYSLFS